MTIGNLQIQPRLSVGWREQTAALVLSLLAAAFVSSLLVATAGTDILTAARAFVQGAFGDWRTFGETLVQSTPLIFTGVAIAVAFRARVWNIGAEGQFFAGATAVLWATRLFPGLPQPLMLGLIVVMAAFGGALWGAVPGLLKARYGSNEVVTTVMMNFIMLFVLSFLLTGAWQDPSSFYAQTQRLPDNAFFPRFVPGTRLHLGFALALVCAVGAFFLMRKTVLGYEIRAVGSNAAAARLNGINVGLTIVLVLVISGALAGLAGGSEVAGLHHRLRLDISTGYGFTGIIIALLARLNPLGVVPAAVLFGALINGSTSMQIATGVPVALTAAIQGITLIFVLAFDAMARYRIGTVGKRG